MRLPIRGWKKTLTALGLRASGSSEKRRRRAAQSYRPQLEPLEPRQLLTGTVADNGDAITIIDDVANDFTGAFTQTGFSYQNNSLVADAYDGDNHNMRGSEGTATWTFDNLEEGEYHVAATWAHKYGNKYNAPDAPFTLRDGETQRSQVLVNQQNLPAEFTDEQEVTWDTLDTISVTSGTLRVELSEAPGNNYVVADAIRIERLGEASPTVTVTVAADSVTEGDGAAATTGTLSLGNATSSDLIVNLNSDDTSEATVPASVTVRAGENSATFEIVAMDDNDSDGTQNVVITASADGFLDGSDTLEVTDDEPAILAIIDNTNEASAAFTQTNFEYKTGTSAYEADNHNWRKNSGPGEAVWTFKNMQNGEYQVAATWYEKYNRATDAPFTIENGSGEVLTTASVNQKNRPDDFTEGGTRWEQLATVNVNDGLLVVRANGSPTNSGRVIADAIRIERIGDIDTTLSLYIPDYEIIEDAFVGNEASGPGSFPTYGKITRSGDTANELVVHLANDDTSEANAPATVTIEAGQASATFGINVIDDHDLDGTQTVTFTATADGFTSSTATLTVTDNEISNVIILDDSGLNFAGGSFEYIENPAAPGYQTGWHRKLPEDGSGTATWWIRGVGLTDGR